jgi:DNA primase large subunit
VADLVRLAYYPFLPEVRQAVREAGPDLELLLRSPLYEGVRRRAVARIEGALEDGFAPAQVTDERAALHELLSVAVARMLAVLVGDKALIARYAGAEARRVEAALAADPDDRTLAEAVAAVGLAAEGEGDAWTLHLSDYLRAMPSEPGWKLVLRPVAAGMVTLSRADMARLVREALQRRLADELEQERARALPEAIVEALRPAAEALAPKLEEARSRWGSGDLGPVRPELFPPCIKEVFESLKRAENVPHHGRFAFATFLHTVGWSSEQILDYLSATPNFDRERSRYQIEHVTGEKSVQAYTPPGCATMQTNGICPLDKRDGLCHRIKHPLSYYRAQVRFRQQDEAKAKAIAEAAAGSQAPAAQAVPR